MRTITFEVELNMFKQGTIRNVEVPVNELNNFWANQGGVIKTKSDLDLIWKYGQNEVQPMELPSVSMGDVIRYQGDRYLILAVGFRKLGEGDITVGYIPRG